MFHREVQRKYQQFSFKKNVLVKKKPFFSFFFPFPKSVQSESLFVVRKWKAMSDWLNTLAKSRKTSSEVFKWHFTHFYYLSYLQWQEYCFVSCLSNVVLFVHPHKYERCETKRVTEKSNHTTVFQFHTAKLRHFFVFLRLQNRRSKMIPHSHVFAVFFFSRRKKCWVGNG